MLRRFAHLHVGHRIFPTGIVEKVLTPFPDDGADLQGMVDGMARIFPLNGREYTRILSTTAVTTEFYDKSIERQHD
jgi:hypothetical protein